MQRRLRELVKSPHESAKVRSRSQYTESRLSARVQLFRNVKAFTYEAWQLFPQRGDSESVAGCSTRFSVSPSPRAVRVYS